jgi:hypothetical protein
MAHALYRPFRSALTLLVLFSTFSPALPCGPAYVSPVFEYSAAPENPYETFAAGRLGIVKTTMNRSVLFAAYRYINGGGFTEPEQKALVEVWKADFDNEDFRNDDVTEALRTWLDERKKIVPADAKLPDIYVERSYGGYDFFPNCTKNAFETAAETLADRAAKYGSDNRSVLDWITAQDTVFANCASGKRRPADVDPATPEWLQKDRAYQLAAASFYSLDYDDAKRRFREIAQDFQSPWQETANYLVARTLVRQGSLTKDAAASKKYYSEAEDHLSRFASAGGKFNDAADRLVALIKYRIHPEERVRELARDLTYQGGNADLRQNVIDYTWLLDKFERKALEALDARRAAENANANDANSASNSANSYEGVANVDSNYNGSNRGRRQNEDDIEISFSSEDYLRSYVIYVPPSAADEEAVAEAERVAGPLSDTMKERVRTARRAAYADRFSTSGSGYEGGYNGDTSRDLSIVPQFLRSDDLTDWLFTYQVGDAEAYLHALSMYRSSGSDLWLMTALAKADKSSTELSRLIEAAGRTSRTSPAFPTIAYHTARIYLEIGKPDDARRTIDEAAGSSDLPISAQNQFARLRLRVAAGLDDFLRSALRRPFAFDFDGSTGTIDEFIAREKTYYNPEYHKDGREAYDREIEERFADERVWENRLMFDFEVIDLMNRQFPQSLLVQVERSPALPEYLRERFAAAIWMRAVLLDDMASAGRIAPELARLRPELGPYLTRIAASTSPSARRHAVLYLILKNPVLTPYLEDGIPRANNEANQWESDDWWCEPYEPETVDVAPSDPLTARLPLRAAFLTAEQRRIAADERKRLAAIGDAPKYLAREVLEWARRYPADRRVPESLYIVFTATGWTKYGCGNDIDLQAEIGELLKSRYPASPWTQRMLTENADNQ